MSKVSRAIGTVQLGDQVWTCDNAGVCEWAKVASRTELEDGLVELVLRKNQILKAIVRQDSELPVTVEVKQQMQLTLVRKVA